MSAAEVFVSYASEDAVAATDACVALEAAGFACWMAPRDVIAGRDYATQILEAIGAARLVLLVLSASANRSPHVRREVERAVSQDVPVLPVRVEDVAPAGSLEYFLASTHWLDAFGAALQQRMPAVVDAVGQLLGDAGAVSEVSDAPGPAPLPGGGILPRSRAVMPTTLEVRGTRGFVGRSEELEVLTTAWHDALAGRASVAAVAGEPGIGKTRLLSEFAGQVGGAPVAVLHGRAEEGLGAPYGPFVEALGGYVAATDGDELVAECGPLAGELGRLLPGLGAKVPGLPAPMRAEPETERFRLVQSVTDLVVGACGAGPVLMVLDDLHWATAADVLMLSHLLRVAAEVDLMVVLAYRDTEVGRGHPLESVLAELARMPGSRRIHLGGLDGDAVSELVGSSVAAGSREQVRRLGSEVHQLTGGNPFFVGEVLRDIGERPADVGSHGVSEGVRAVVARRLARLPAGAEDVLMTAALIGARFDLPLLLAASADDAACVEAVAAAESAGLVVPDPEQAATYRFAHALVQATLQDQLPSARRLVLHAELGRALEELTGGTSRLPELSRHFTEAASLGEIGRAVRYAGRAGEAARDALDFELAASHFGARRRVLENDPHRQPVELARAVVDEGNALLAGGRVDEARSDFVRAAGLARELGDVSLLVRAALAMRGPFRVRVQDPVELGLLEEAAAAAPADDRATRARLAAHLSLALPDTDPRFLELARAATALGEGVDDPVVRHAVAASRVWSSFSPQDLADLRSAAEDAVQAADEAGSPEMLADALEMAILAADQTGDREAAERELARLEWLADRAGGPWFVSSAAGARAKRLADAGEFDRAEELLAEVVVRYPDGGALLAWGSIVISNRRWRGRHTEVDELVRANADNSDKDRALVAVDQALLASQLALTGRWPEAHVLLQELLLGAAIPLPRRGSWATQPVLALSADAAIASGDVVTAPRLREQLADWSGLQLQASMGVFLGPADLYVGRLDALLGDETEAVAHLERAVQLSDATGSVMWAALGRAALAGVLREREPARAESERARAMEVADALGLGLVREVLAR